MGRFVVPLVRIRAVFFGAAILMLVFIVVAALTAGCGSSSRGTAPITGIDKHAPAVHAHGQFLVQTQLGEWTLKGRLFLVDAASGRARLLTRDCDTDEIPRWSPDGKHVVCPAGGVDQDDLISYPVSGGRPSNLTRTKKVFEFAARWSPDGTRIAYLLQRAGDKFPPTDLYVAAADGAHPHRVARFADGFAWSPDGRRIAFDPGLDRWTSRLLVVPARGGRARPLGPAGSGERIEWGPGGRILYTHDGVPSDPTYLWNGSRPQSIGFVMDEQFLPDGTVAFGLERSVGFVHPDGTRSEVMLVDRQNSYSWSTDGRYLAFASPWGSGHVYVARGDGSGIRRLPVRLGTWRIEVFGWRPTT